MNHRVACGKFCYSVSGIAAIGNRFTFQHIKRSVPWGLNVPRSGNHPLPGYVFRPFPLQLSSRPIVTISHISSPSNVETIERGMKVTLHYESHDADTGEFLESSKVNMEESEAIENIPEELKGVETMNLGLDTPNFIAGYNQVIQGMDEAVLGMKIGEEKTFVCAPEEAYGTCQPNSIEILSRENFPSECKSGDQIHLADGTTATFKNFTEDGKSVVVDRSRPFAGRSVKVHVRIVDVEKIPPIEILRHEPGNGINFPKMGDSVLIHCKGYQDGVDQPWLDTHRNSQPLLIEIGAGEAFPALEEGLMHMSIGESIYVDFDPRLAPLNFASTVGSGPVKPMQIKISLLAIGPLSDEAPKIKQGDSKTTDVVTYATISSSDYGNRSRLGHKERK